MTLHDFYVIWALLPNSIELSHKFEDQREHRLRICKGQFDEVIR